MNAPATLLDLAVGLVTLPGGRSAVSDGTGAQSLRIPDARDLFDRGPVIVAHAGMTAKRLGLNTPPRSPRLFDALELFAFVRPATI